MHENGKKIKDEKKTDQIRNKQRKNTENTKIYMKTLKEKKQEEKKKRKQKIKQNHENTKPSLKTKTRRENMINEQVGEGGSQ